MSRHAGAHKRWITAVLLSGLQACASGPEIEHLMVEDVAPVPSGPILSETRRIQQGDVVLIRFLNNPELDTEAYVRPDGAITIALVGEVTAAGQTLSALREDISQRYREFVLRTRYGDLLKEGDEIELRFVNNPELNLKVRIRSDGKISLPLVGDAPAAGMPPMALREHLLRRYAVFIRDPDLALITGFQAAKKVYSDEAFLSLTLIKRANEIIFVGGEVAQPGAVTIQGQMTALQAINAAGGLTPEGDLSKVVILRRGQYEQGEWMRTNLDTPLSGKHFSNDLALRPGDVMLVPKSRIAKVNLWVRQYVRDALPILTNTYIIFIPYQKAAGVPVPQSQQAGTPGAPPTSSPTTGGVAP